MKRASFLGAAVLIAGYIDPRRYVGTDAVSGQLQFELLKRQGCNPRSKVLEIGRACLHAGIPLIEFLGDGNYVGIDPNEWLRRRAMRNSRVRRLISESGPDF